MEELPHMPDSEKKKVFAYLACFPARPIKLSRDRQTTIGRADGNTVVVVTHDPDIGDAAPRRLWLHDGAIAEDRSGARA